jgi:hypothetical protein
MGEAKGQTEISITELEYCELFNLSKREKRSEKLESYIVNLFSVINQGVFGKHDCAAFE